MLIKKIMAVFGQSGPVPALCAAVCASLLLSACGGGGASSTPVAQAPVAPAAPAAPITPPAPLPAPAPVTAPVVTVQQASKNVLPGATVTFDSAVIASGTISSQWFRNNSAIPGATSASYVHPAVLPSDSATAIRVQVNDTVGTTLSRPVVLDISGPGVFPVAGANSHASPTSSMVASLPASGLEVSQDGYGQQARFTSIANLAFDNAGILYATDNLNFNVRRITPEGLVSTLAGGSPGSSNVADGVRRCGSV